MPSEDVLQRAALRLVKAMAVYRLRPTVSAANRVIEARLAVKEAFIAAGWKPPASTIEAMDRDRLLLRERAGRLDDPGDSDDGRSDRRASKPRTTAMPGHLGLANGNLAAG